MTDQTAFAGTRPISWPRAAISAAFLFGLMSILLVVVPNQFVSSEPSQFTKIVTIVYVVVLFAAVAWMSAAWQNRGLTTPQPVSQKVSAFGRPMREGPGFASFAERAAPESPQQPTRSKSVDVEPVENASAFGRPLKKRSK